MYETAAQNTRSYPQAAGSSAIERAPSAVTSAQGALDNNTNRLHSILGELESRLQPVLGPSKPSGVNSAATPPPASVSARINDSAGAVGAAISRIEDILSRLEV